MVRLQQERCVDRVMRAVHFESTCEQLTWLWLHPFYVINKFIVALIARYMQMMPETTREFVRRAFILDVTFFAVFIACCFKNPNFSEVCCTFFLVTAGQKRILLGSGLRLARQRTQQITLLSFHLKMEVEPTFETSWFLKTPRQWIK
jgi:hypothetical protein